MVEEQVVPLLLLLIPTFLVLMLIPTFPCGGARNYG
jgi:hypothetical protein